MPDALTRVPTARGPIWPVELRQVEPAVRRIDRVVAVGVEERHDHAASARSSRSACAPSSRSRTSIRLASLPSTSPAWMPLMHQHDGQPAPRAPRRACERRAPTATTQRQLAAAGARAERRRRGGAGRRGRRARRGTPSRRRGARSRVAGGLGAGQQHAVVIPPSRACTARPGFARRRARTRAPRRIRSRGSCTRRCRARSAGRRVRAPSRSPASSRAPTPSPRAPGARYILRSSNVPGATGNTRTCRIRSPRATQNAPPRSAYADGSSRSSVSVGEPSPNASPNSASVAVTSSITAPTSSRSTNRISMPRSYPGRGWRQVGHRYRS